MRDKIITFNGKSLTLTEWSEKLGINKSTLTARLNRFGMTVEQALTVKVKSKPRFRKMTADDEEMFMKCFRKGVSAAHGAKKCFIGKPTYKLWCEELRGKIVAMSESGAPISEIMKKFNLSYSRVQACLRKQIDNKKQCTYTNRDTLSSNGKYVPTGRPMPPSYPPKPMTARVDPAEVKRIEQELHLSPPVTSIKDRITARRIVTEMERNKAAIYSQVSNGTFVKI